MVFCSHKNRDYRYNLTLLQPQPAHAKKKKKHQLPKFCFKLYSVKLNPKVKLLIFLGWFSSFSTLEKRHDTFAARLICFCLEYSPESTVHLLAEHQWKPGLLSRKKEQELPQMPQAGWSILCNPLKVVLLLQIAIIAEEMDLLTGATEKWDSLQPIYQNAEPAVLAS